MNINPHTNIYNISVERCSPEEILDIYNKFIDAGWEYYGKWDLVNVHRFLKFYWDVSKGDPVYPPGHEPLF